MKLIMPFLIEIRALVRQEQRMCCAFCGVKCQRLEVHHKVPAEFGGADDRDNAVGLCLGCHDMFDLAARGGESYETTYSRLQDFFYPD